MQRTAYEQQSALDDGVRDEDVGVGQLLRLRGEDLVFPRQAVAVVRTGDEPVVHVIVKKWSARTSSPK